MWGSEYGVETNFWLKFRPYLHCKHTPRLGPELGGMKFWCNPDYFEVHSQQTRYLLTTNLAIPIPKSRKEFGCVDSSSLSVV